MLVKATLRLTGEERKAAIVQAVRRVFAANGFRGTTTRELAAAAGVSEALMFKHFPSKQALYAAMKHTYCEKGDPAVERLRALAPSTSTLVTLVHFLFSRSAGERSATIDEDKVHLQLMFHSIMEDGEFARIQMRQVAAGWVSKVEQCLAAAVDAGDAVDRGMLPDLGAWFTYHLSFTLMHYLRPATPIVEYGVPREKLVEQAVLFTLRGLGLKDEAIERHYNASALALLIS
jgi:AcrR family transcriptional regulator